jgi:hypothetical protein
MVANEFAGIVAPQACSLLRTGGEKSVSKSPVKDTFLASVAGNAHPWVDQRFNVPPAIGCEEDSIMDIRRSAAIVAAGALLAACAIHPEPENVTGIDTADIVKQIRCETRDAARKIILNDLEALGTGGDAKALALFSEFQATPDLMTTFNPTVSFPGPGYSHVRDFFNVIYSAAIAYNFDLTMNEENDLGTTANFLGQWQSKLMLGITGDVNRTRENLRTFTIADTFNYLLTTLNNPVRGVHYCDGHVAQGSNYIYPLAGRIGVYNTVYEFFQMALFDNLAADKAKPGVGGAPALADQLTFTTTVDLLPTPKFIFSPVKTAWQIADISSPATFKRKDTHQVTVAVALDSKGSTPLTSIRGFVFSSERTSGVSSAPLAVGTGAAGSQILVLNRIVASTTTPATQLAVYKIDQLKSREVQLLPPPSP